MKTYKLIQSLSASLLLIGSAMIAIPAQAEGGHNSILKNKKSYNGCAQYRLSSYGGESGFRLMSNQGDFRSTKNGSVAGQVCASGRVTLEIAKRNQNAHATVEILGRSFEFRQGDRGDKHENGWFRRYYQVDLPHKTSHRGQHNNTGSNHVAVPAVANNGHYNNHQTQTNNHGARHTILPRNQYAYNNDYQPKEYLYRHLDNSQQYHPPQRFHNQSRKHRRAHRYNIPHQHQGHHFTFN